MSHEHTADTAFNPDNTENTAERFEIQNESPLQAGEAELPENDQSAQPEMTREERVMRKLYGCMHVLSHRKRPHMAQGQGRLLAILIRTGKVSQRDLQDMTGIRSASLSELLKKLEANGFIMREQNEEDRRSVDISLTEAGETEAERLRSERDAGRNLFSALSEEELEQLEILLTKLMKAWDPEGEFSPHNPGRKGHRGEFRHGHGRGHGRRHDGAESCKGDCEGHGHGRGRRGRGHSDFDRHESGNEETERDS